MRARQTFKEQARGRVRKMRLRKRCCGWSHHRAEDACMRAARLRVISRICAGGGADAACGRARRVVIPRQYTLRGPDVRGGTRVRIPCSGTTTPRYRRDPPPLQPTRSSRAARGPPPRGPGGTAPDSRSPIPAARGPRDVQLTCSAAALVEKPARPDTANSSLERSSPSVCRSRVAGQASLDVCEAGYALLDFRVERRRS